MAFWGIAVKPGKPFTHSCEKARGRLRISQATLGIGEATKKTTLQCNVGKRSPVLLCALLPNKTESCHLDLEFEEADDVVFSVIGPRSVYLTGYYVRPSSQSNLHSDTESYGVDIENTQTDGSSYCSDDDKYEDSFIDDDELQVSPQSPVLTSKGIEEVTLENDKPKDRKGPGKQLKKKFQLMESDNDAHSRGNEDEDGYCSSVFKSRRAVQTTVSNAEEKAAQVTVEMGDEANDKVVCDESKQKGDPLDIHGKLERVIKLPLDEEVTGVENKIYDLANPKELVTPEEIIVSNEKVSTGNMVHGINTKDNIIDQNLPEINGNDPTQIQSLDIAKPKRKRKELSMRVGKICKSQNDDKDLSVLREDKEHEVEASINPELDANYVVSPIKLGSVNGQKSKKRKNELLSERTQAEGIDKKSHNIPKDEVEHFLHSDSVTKDIAAANGENRVQHMSEGTRMVDFGTKCDDMPKEEKFVPDLLHADHMSSDPPAENGACLQEQVDNNISINPELLANDDKPEKKIKKKMKTTQGKKDLNMGLTETTENEETTLTKYENETTNMAPIQTRTLSNGLVIEELASGPPDGKVAAPGKKVKIFYTGMLKENGHVFDSNVGKTAFKFHLGDEKFIDGWNLGIDGMRVGDKRRLIIPPSMGFGNHAVGENVPPNSWLVYDIELVGIRR